MLKRCVAYYYFCLKSLLIWYYKIKRTVIRAPIKRSIDVTRLFLVFCYNCLEKKRKRKQYRFLFGLSLCCNPFPDYLHVFVAPSDISFPFFPSHYHLPLSIFQLSDTIREIGDDIYDKAILQGYVGAIKWWAHGVGLF